MDRDNLRVLIIKHGALGDFVLSVGPFTAIREHHKNSIITLLTTLPYVEIAEKSGLFDQIWSDPRPPLWNILMWVKIIRRLRSGRFDRVYDLQTSTRSNTYYKLLGINKPEWSGIAPGCSLPHNNPNRDKMHTIERQREQLRFAGIKNCTPSELSWLDENVSDLISRKNNTFPNVLIIAGGSPHRQNKRWPAHSYVQLSNRLYKDGLQPILIGTHSEKEVIDKIHQHCPESLNLCGCTSLSHIATLARQAKVAVGNDTGPMHITASVGCPTMVIFSDASDPSITLPRGPNVRYLQIKRMDDLMVEEVYSSLNFF